MRRPAGRKSRMALFASIALLAASTTPAATAQSSLSGCVPYNSSSTAGNPGDVSIAEPTYFSCADDGFLVGVHSNSSNNPLDALSWTCSGGEVIGSISSDTLAEDSVSFAVGITSIWTTVEGYFLPFLEDVYIGGYDLDFGGTGVSYSLKGLLGDFDDDDDVLPDIQNSSCGNESYATGATVWSSDSFVYGVMLECADLAETCAPPSYPTNAIAGVTTSPTPSPSAIVATTDPPSPSPNTVDITLQPSPFDGITPVVDTPSPSMNTITSSDEIMSAGESSSSSVSTAAVVGGSVAGGLLVLAVCIGALFCFYRHKGRRTRHPENPRDTFGTPARTVRRGPGGGGTASEGEAVPSVVYASAAPAPDPRGPPPPYVAPPHGQTSVGAPRSSIP